MSATTKKVILFVVEGMSDETAFALIFERLFNESAVKFDIVHGDVTTDLRGKTARDRVREQVADHVQRQDYRWDDVDQIVQITDMDGAYVDAEKVVPSADGTLRYGADEIQAPNPEGIVARNEKKSTSLDELSRVDRITWNRTSVPYRIYYLSRNMEHALHGVAGEASDREKERLARRFQQLYKDDLEGFRSFLRGEIAVGGSYRETWKHIKEGTNSLRRNSNLHLVLPTRQQRDDSAPNANVDSAAYPKSS